MSLITFRDKNTSGDPVGPTWYLNFDALTVEELTRSAEVTQYPVETGATLSDHYQPLPREISLTGVITDTRISLLGARSPAKLMALYPSKHRRKPADETSMSRDSVVALPDIDDVGDLALRLPVG